MNAFSLIKIMQCKGIYIFGSTIPSNLEPYCIFYEPCERIIPNSGSHDVEWASNLLTCVFTKTTVTHVRHNWEDKQRWLKDLATGHNIMQKWKQKTEMLPPSDPFFLFHFYSFASSRSAFPIMLHLRSIVLSLSLSLPILKYFKRSPAGHRCSS